MEEIQLHFPFFCINKLSLFDDSRLAWSKAGFKYGIFFNQTIMLIRGITKHEKSLDSDLRGNDVRYFALSSFAVIPAPYQLRGKLPRGSNSFSKDRGGRPVAPTETLFSC
jgi:hypothetical protein